MENQVQNKIIQIMTDPTQNLTAYKKGFTDIELSEFEIKYAIESALIKKRMEYDSMYIEYKSENDFIAELTELEKEKALYSERYRKQCLINECEYWNKVKSSSVALKLDSNQTKLLFENEFFKMQGKNFIYDESNSKIMQELFYYFSGDEKFSGDFSKGILLIGQVGCGKSSVMEALKNNSNQSFIIHSCRKITYEYTKVGFEVVEKHIDVLKTVSDRFGNYERATCYDDFGAETNRKHFGDSANIMEEILTSRYDLRRHNMTHLTTNLTGAEIEEFYGQRLKSRFYEMFNVFVFANAKDRRKINE